MNNNLMMNHNNNTQRSSPPSSTSSPLTPQTLLHNNNNNNGMMFNDQSMPPPSSISPGGNSNNINVFSTLQQIASSNPNSQTMQLLKHIQTLPPNLQQLYLQRLLQQLNQLKTTSSGDGNIVQSPNNTTNHMMLANNNNNNIASTAVTRNNQSNLTMNAAVTQNPLSSSNTPTIDQSSLHISSNGNSFHVNNNNNGATIGPGGILNLVNNSSTVSTQPSSTTMTSLNVKNNSGSGLFDLTMFSNQATANSKNPVLQNLSNDILLKLYQQQMQSQHPFNHGDKFVFEQQTFEYQVETLDDLLKIGIGRWKNLIQSNLVNNQQQQQQQQQLISSNGNMTMNNVVMTSNNNNNNNMGINSMNNNIMNGMNGTIVTTATNQPVYIAPGNSAFQKYMKDSLHGSVQYFPQRQVDGSVKMNE
ncbi:hypothetical protein NAEGRDRAFT_81999 [Naegleria gruberi]|uniref:Uncharacterized protein n=1 Tax=Naegleria gruberi TaxID=5762 RepID=D2W155_NAEGR|nr:uncharacterized protein NAEGRDRAFT_81999 [Naegleria gruberi]EFC37122.1 hypothetical protein NAEGRDRAFT_81999 [Naegleria gruberi]|eukprot:XP_002669866.1 hypothetical protein NAEGRDRAFT_81999 [Naegleria gruberi strain NEG-M]